MTDIEINRPADRCPFHPRAVLDDIFPAMGKSKAEIARLLGISRQQLYDILTEKKPMSPNIAARIGKLIGNGPAIWLRMQASHNAWHAQRKLDVSAIPTLSAA
ncbi:HigA family addiction module antitoxin [Rhizobium sp.]